MTTTTLLLILLATLGLSLILIILLTKKGIVLTSLAIILANHYLIEAIIGSRYFHGSRIMLTRLIQIQGIIPGLILIFLFIIRLLNKNNKAILRVKSFEWGLLLFLLGSICASLIGVLYENSIWYLIGDQFKYVYFSLGYFFIAFSLKSAEDRQWIFSVLIILGSVFSIAGLITQFANFAILGRSTISSGIEPAVPIFLFLTIIFSSKLKYSYPRSWNVMFLMTLITVSAIISRSRRDVLNVIFSFFGSIWLIPNKTKVFVNLSKYISAGLFLFLLLFILSTPYLGEQYQNIWDATYRRVIGQTARGLPSDGRYIEIADAIQYTAELPGSYLNFLFGLGSGAEYETSRGYGKNLAEGRILNSQHQIHNTYFSILFRLGVFGLFFFISFVIGILFNTYKLAYKKIRQGLFNRDATVHFIRLATLLLTILLISTIEWNVAYTLGSGHLIIILGIIGAELRYSVLLECQSE